MENDKLLNKKELGQFLGCSERKIDYMRQKNSMPFLRLGDGAVRFDLEEIKRWLKTQSSNCHDEKQS